MARIPWGLRMLDRLDPLLRWLALDGYGFHQGYFRSNDYVEQARTPNVPRGYAQRAFDQGLGRSLWFVRGADVQRIAQTIGRFPESRRADLWSGVGLAAAYAGGIESADLQALRRLAQPYLSELAQGAAFAAKARDKAGNPASHTELACEVLCGMSAHVAARLAGDALSTIRPDGSGECYEAWRAGIRTLWRERSVSCIEA
jgi:hypothetical protein